jgi:hypothetical protein
MNIAIQSMGGKATAIILRKKALEEYYKNPNICLNCGSIIEVKNNQKIREVRSKRFCNMSCSGTYNGKRIKKSRIRVCKKCNAEFETKRNNGRRFCDVCKYKKDGDDFGLKTKGYLFEKRKNWQSARTAIRRHAEKIYGAINKGERKCKACGYEKHTELCHIKPVSKFEDEATLNEINKMDNLIVLCPNHHWEFDNGIIKI